MVKRHPTALLLSSTLTIPLLLGGCTQHYEVKEPMSQPCQTAAVHSNAVFYPVRGSIDPSFVFSGAWIENGRMKTTLEGGWAYDPPLPGYNGDLIEGEPVTIPGTGTFELIGITLSRWATHQKPSPSASHPTPICSTTPKNTSHQAKRSHPKTRTRKTHATPINTHHHCMRRC